MIVGTVRDILIIFLALTSIVVWVLLGVLIWQIWRLTRMVQDELKPMIDDTRQTIATVRGTATFMSENVVAPVIQTSSRLAGYRRIVQVLLGRAPRAAAGSEKMPPPQGTPGV
ncbi:MAG: hypothetical protein ACOYL7_01365 [Caldilinea sp.]|jgi:hypothetical protein